MTSSSEGSDKPSKDKTHKQGNKAKDLYKAPERNTQPGRTDVTKEIDRRIIAYSFEKQYEDRKIVEKIIPAQLTDGEFGFLLVKKGEKIPVEKKWQNNLYKSTDQHFLDHLKNGGNYGISPRNGKACIVDADTKEIQDSLDTTLPETFRYSTGKEGHFQYVYLLDETIGNIPLLDGAYVKGKGGFAVGPGSLHPNGRRYGLEIRNVPIARIEKELLLKKIDQFIISKSYSKTESTRKADLREVPDEKVQKNVEALMDVWTKADGVRHELALAICGFYKKSLWPESAVQKLIDLLVKKSEKGEEHRVQVSYNYSYGGAHEYGFPTIKSIAKEKAAKLGEIGETARKDPVLEALKCIASMDEDHASVENGEGFNKLDTELGHALAYKDLLTREEHKLGKALIKKYKNQLPAQLFLDAINSTYTKSVEETSVKNMPDMEGWMPFSFTNDEPTAWAGWKDGFPFTRNVKMSSDEIEVNERKITLKEYDGQPIQNRIKKVKDEEGKDILLFDGEAFTKPEFVSEMVYPVNVNAFTEALNALQTSNEIYREPRFYIENGHIRFPEHYYAKRGDSYQRILKRALNIGPVDIEVYKNGIDLLRKYPKQLTLYYSIYGANVANFLEVNDYPITIDAKGYPDAGKSFAIIPALKFGYGIGDAMLQDDAMNSAFRHHALTSSTDLPIYTEEAKISDKSKLKSRALNLRGNPNKTMDAYSIKATWILSRNTDLLNAELDPIQKKAEDKRIYLYQFGKEDVVPKDERNKGKRLLQRLRDMPGGLLYKKLEEKTIDQITDKYYELMEQETDGRKVVALLGAWLMDDTDFTPVVSEEQTPNIEEEFIDKIVSAYRRIENMKMWQGESVFRSTFEDKQLNNELTVDWEKMIFKITVTGFNCIKRQLGITLSAEKFAEAHDYQYGTFSIGGERSKMIKGTVPEEYKEEPPQKRDSSSDEGIDDYEIDGTEGDDFMDFLRRKQQEEKRKESELDRLLG